MAIQFNKMYCTLNPLQGVLLVGFNSETIYYSMNEALKSKDCVTDQISEDKLENTRKYFSQCERNDELIYGKKVVWHNELTSINKLLKQSINI